MSGTQPVAVYAMKVPPGDIMVPACPEFAAMFRVSMAAIDPSAEPEISDDDDKKPPRATLKIIRFPDDSDDSGSDEDSEGEEMDLLNGLGEDESSDEEEDNGGPSDPKKSKKNILRALIKAAEEDEDEDMEENDEEDVSDDEEADAKAALKKLMKGKDKAVNGEESDSDLEGDDDDALDMEEIVICTLDPEKHYQQPLDFVVGENERIFFKVTGTHTIHLTGNYVIPIDDGQTSLYDGEEEEEDYDLSPDEDELDALEDEEEESDDLDDLDDPRITELDSEEESAPKLVKATTKGKNKRPAEDSGDESEKEAGLDDIMAKALKPEGPETNGEPKNSARLRKEAEEAKKNDGQAAPTTTPAPAVEKKTADTKDTPTNNSNVTEKKVQFAKNLEQGPTPSVSSQSKAKKLRPKKPNGPTSTPSLGVRDVQGVTVDDRKIGTGPGAKKGSRVEMRYIGKLETGKQFDANKSGKPFSFKLGAGEVIKGWDIGLAGIAVGGERRITIPAHLGYGKKGAPPSIPPNSKLVFDVKCLSIH